MPPMKGTGFIDKVCTIARERGVFFRIDTKRGKGSHITIYDGTRKTVVKDRRKELPTGLLSAMARQLGLTSDNFR